MYKYYSVDIKLLEKAQKFESFRKQCKDYLSKHGRCFDKFTVVQHDSFIGYISEHIVRLEFLEKLADSECKVYSWDSQFDMRKIIGAVNSDDASLVDYVQEYFYDKYDIAIETSDKIFEIDVKSAFTSNQPRSNWNYQYPVIQANKVGKEYAVLAYCQGESSALINNVVLIGYCEIKQIKQCSIDKKGTKTERGTINQVDNYHTLLNRDYRDIDDLISIIKNSTTPSLLIYSEVPYNERFKHFLPFYSVRVACGAFIDGGVPEVDGWIRGADINVNVNEGLFAVRAHGDSMFSTIHSGDYCVFRRTSSAENGDVVLVQYRDYDPDYSGKYTIKRLSLVYGDDNTLKKIKLCPDNDKYQSIILSDEDDFRILGVLTQVVPGMTDKKDLSGDTTNDGYCIHCGGPIKFCFGKESPKYFCDNPVCIEASKRSEYNIRFKEFYCHKCGSLKKACYNRDICVALPICHDCWR